MFVCSPDSDGVCLEANGLCLSGGEDLEEGVQFSVWVSFYEIYNEFLYDLLDAPPSLQYRKRATLRLSDDKHGNPYVKGKNHRQNRNHIFSYLFKCVNFLLIFVFLFIYFLHFFQFDVKSFMSFH